MDDAELQRLTRAVQGHRTRAVLAREEAAARGPGWWGYDVLKQSADYYDRRAEETEHRLRRLTGEDQAEALSPQDRQP